jgi:hypothetical protein
LKPSTWLDSLVATRLLLLSERTLLVEGVPHFGYLRPDPLRVL